MYVELYRIIVLLVLTIVSQGLKGYSNDKINNPPTHVPLVLHIKISPQHFCANI